MDSKVLFLDVVIFLTFLTLILSNVFLTGLINLSIVLILLLVYTLAYKFIYKFGNFQKILFILSICSFLFFMSLYDYWFFNSYIPLLIILNWYIIWLIFKDVEGGNDKLIDGKSFVFMGLFFYLVFNLILVFSEGGFVLTETTVIANMEPNILEIIGICLLSMSLIFSIVFVATTLYGKYSFLSYEGVDRF